MWLACLVGKLHVCSNDGWWSAGCSYWKYALVALYRMYIVHSNQWLCVATIGGVNEDLDEMAELERKARQMAEEAERDQPRRKRDVLFVRLLLSVCSCGCMRVTVLILMSPEEMNRLRRWRR